MATEAVEVSFKDPDFEGQLKSHGLPAKVIRRLVGRAAYGEYWTLRLVFSSEGTFSGQVVKYKG